MKFYKYERMKKAAVIDPQNKCCGGDDLKEEHEDEISPTPSDPTVNTETGKKKHPPSSYLHVEIF